jgi:hypothetical protein
MTMSFCWWRGASGIAWANDANVNAKASAINLVMTMANFARLGSATAWDLKVSSHSITNCSEQLSHLGVS